jgi:hypothetical protein
VSFNRLHRLLSATHPLSRGKSYIDPAWYKTIGWIDSNFKSGDSIKGLYLSKYKEIQEDTYKICFHFREVHRKCGLCNMLKDFVVYMGSEE